MFEVGTIFIFGIFCDNKFHSFRAIFRQVRFNCKFQSSHQHREHNMSYLDESGIWSFVFLYDYVKYLLTFVTNWTKIGFMKLELEAAELFPERSSHRFTAECTRLELSVHSAAVCARAQRAIEKNDHFFFYTSVNLQKKLYNFLRADIFLMRIMNWFIIVQIINEKLFGAKFSHMIK